MTSQEPGLRDLALVLRRFDYGETSQIGRLFTRGSGRLSVLARGVKRKGPELRGPLDLFALAEVEMVERPRSELYLLTRYRVATGFPGLRRLLERLDGAFYVAEVLREGTRDLDPSEQLFDAAVSTLGALEAAPKSACGLVVAWWDLAYLRISGQAPELGACVLCGAEAPPGKSVRYSLTRGGLICRSCAAGGAFALDAISKERRALLQGLATMPEPPAGGAVRTEEATRRWLRAFLGRIMQFTLDREILSLPEAPV